MKRLFVLLLCLALLLVGCGQKKDAADKPAQAVVGVWQSCEVFDPESETIRELPSDYSTLTLRENHSGSVDVSGQQFSLEWTYLRTDDDGSLVFSCSVDGAGSRMYYKPDYDEVWLYTGDYLLMYGRGPS